MSSEIQLVLIGGIIAIVSSISTALLTTLLTYKLENRREKHKLKIELSKALGRVAQEKGTVTEDRDGVLGLYQDFVLKRQLGPEDLSFMLGIFSRYENPKQKD